MNQDHNTSETTPTDCPFCRGQKPGTCTHDLRKGLHIASETPAPAKLPTRWQCPMCGSCQVVDLPGSAANVYCAEMGCGAPMGVVTDFPKAHELDDRPHDEADELRDIPPMRPIIPPPGVHTMAEYLRLSRPPPSIDEPPEECEGCGAPSITRDPDGVPLCRPCAELPGEPETPGIQSFSVARVPLITFRHPHQEWVWLDEARGVKVPKELLAASENAMRPTVATVTCQKCGNTLDLACCRSCAGDITVSGTSPTVKAMQNELEELTRRYDALTRHSQAELERTRETLYTAVRLKLQAQDTAQHFRKCCDHWRKVAMDAKLIAANTPCTRAPVGWRCTRTADHDGPCAAVTDEQPAKKGRWQKFFHAVCRREMPFNITARVFQCWTMEHTLPAGFKRPTQ